MVTLYNYFHFIFNIFKLIINVMLYNAPHYNYLNIIKHVELTKKKKIIILFMFHICIYWIAWYKVKCAVVLI